MLRPSCGESIIIPHLKAGSCMDGGYIASFGGVNLGLWTSRSRLIKGCWRAAQYQILYPRFEITL